MSPLKSLKSRFLEPTVPKRYTVCKQYTVCILHTLRISPNLVFRQAVLCVRHISGNFRFKRVIVIFAQILRTQAKICRKTRKHDMLYLCFSVGPSNARITHLRKNKDSFKHPVLLRLQDVSYICIRCLQTGLPFHPVFLRCTSFRLGGTPLRFQFEGKTATRGGDKNRYTETVA